MTKEELIAQIRPSKRPYFIRKGQYIFNWIDEHFQYGNWPDDLKPNAMYSSVAREVQFLDKIDCFYDDSKIDEFLDACIKRINKL